MSAQTDNVQMLQEEILNTIDRCQKECVDLTITEVLGVLENVKLAMWYQTQIKEDDAE